MARGQKGWEWTVAPAKDGTYTHDQAQLAVLMDIRDELRSIRERLECADAMAIPRILKRIAANTTKPRKKKVAKKKRTSA